MSRYKAMYCYHIMALLPQDYDRSLIPGYKDTIYGIRLGCGFSLNTSSKRTSSSETKTEKSKKMKIDCYFKKEDTSKPSTSTVLPPDELDSSDADFHTPWKIVVLHKGTKNDHWHFLYIASHRSFKNNSRLGIDISHVQYKVQKVKCIICLQTYLHSGNGREVLTDSLTENDKYLACCSKHNTGSDPSLSEVHVDCDNDLIDLTSDNGIIISNAYLIQLFTENKCFTESAARVLLTANPNGQEFLFKRFANDKIKIAIQTSKMITFGETPFQRLQRAKQYYEKVSYDIDFSIQLSKLVRWLQINSINEKEFAIVTYNHFYKQSGKKNNLFFKGPPSTGKSMIIESLVNCHFNYTRLTGVNESSSFNFSSLVHSNACLMDEIKLTDPLFEVWKLLAAGQTFSTDVKYHDKCEITNCVLYTASNYDIHLYCRVPSAKEAIEARTYTYYITEPCTEFFNVAPHTWELFWNIHSRCDECKGDFRFPTHSRTITSSSETLISEAETDVSVGKPGCTF